MHYESNKKLTENLTLARHDLANFIAKKQDTLPTSDIDYLQERVLNRLNTVHQHLYLLNDEEK